MATRTPIECPICRQVLANQPLEEHLLYDHSKRRLAKFVVSETEAMNYGDVS
ncbi:hypothetical protein [Natrarchaeobius oligotrophus]|uniref:hypothetical protein n=1 Tax=Natrarchaeobius oligotrophus TaxID=3455743 RepID=UPI001404A2BA|nr:hypothetical protein [Natrarchaeobius chitinivorans]